MYSMKQGSKGEDVKILQQALNNNGFSCGEVDGAYGCKTSKAVSLFQQKNKLIVDSIAGKKTCAALGILEKIEAAQKLDNVSVSCPYICQADAPHGSKIYGPDKTYTTYKSGGCCPTSIACVVRAFYDKNVTVESIGDLCIKGGYRVKGSGTNAGAINYVMKKYGGSAHSFTASKENFVKYLKAGNLIILCIKKGFGNLYEGSGHYIVVYGYKDGKFLLRDVGSHSDRRQWVLASDIPTGIKCAYYCVK